MIIKKEILQKLMEDDFNELSLELSRILKCRQQSLFTRIRQCTMNFRTNSIVQEFIKSNLEKLGFTEDEIFEKLEEF